MQASLTEGIRDFQNASIIHYIHDANFRKGVSFARRFSYVRKVLKVAVILASLACYPMATFCKKLLGSCIELLQSYVQHLLLANTVSKDTQTRDHDTIRKLENCNASL